MGDILSTFFCAEKGAPKDVSSALLIQPLSRNSSSSAKLTKPEDPVRCLCAGGGAGEGGGGACPARLVLVRGGGGRWLGRVGVREGMTPPWSSLPPCAVQSGADAESGADDSDVEEATRTAGLTSLYSPVHAKKVAWRVLRDIITELRVFDPAVQPNSAAQDPSTGARPETSVVGSCVPSAICCLPSAISRVLCAICSLMPAILYLLLHCA